MVLGFLGYLEEKWDKFMLNDDRHWFANYWLNIFDKNLPGSGWVKEFGKLPSFPMYIMGGLFNIMWWACFLYFIVTQYKSGVSDTFISLDPKSGDCHEVPFVLDGSYLADSSGHWDSNKKFDDATAIYDAHFEGYSSTTSQYVQVIDTLAADFEALGEMGAKRDLAYNLVSWTAFSVLNKDNGRVTFSPVGEISTMLNRQYFLGGMVLNEAQLKTSDTCLNSASSTVTFESVSGQVVFSFSMGSAVTYNNVTVSGSSKHCRHMARHLGYKPSEALSDDFVAKFNVNSFASAVAVNYNIMSPSSFTKITDSPKKGYQYNTDDDHSGITYYGSSSYYSSEDDFSESSYAVSSEEDDYFTKTPTSSPTESPSSSPTESPTAEPTAEPTAAPTEAPTSRRRRLVQVNSNGVAERTLITNVDTLKRRSHVKDMENMAELAAKEAVSSEAAAELLATSSSSTGRFVRYYDPKYTQMDPIYCYIETSSTLSACFLQLVGKGGVKGQPVYAYPVMKHFNDTDCSSLTSGYTKTIQPNGTWSKHYDHSIDMLLGLIAFPALADAKSFAAESIRIRTESTTDGDTVIPKRIHASMVAVANSDGTTTGYNQTAICGRNSTTGTDRDCFLITFNTFGPGYYINSHNYQLFAGACRNSVYNSITFAQIAKSVPQPLVQDYVQCTLKPWDSFYQALGLASGNADIYARWAFYVLMATCVYTLYKRRGYDSEMFSFTSPAQEERDAQPAAKEGALEGVDSKEYYPSVVKENEPYSLVPTAVIGESAGVDIEMVDH
jgi:hypothetical protein